MKRSNCLLFALALWRRRGGYLAVRRSRHIAGWHWIWLSPDRRRLLHYEPIRPMAWWPAATLHKLWYRGRVCRDD